jgi:hypothetical protein
MTPSKSEVKVSSIEVKARSMEAKVNSKEVKIILFIFSLLLTVQPSLGKMICLPFLHSAIKKNRREIIS